eukprot:672780-Prorocentrum_minimum.AAC.1
MIWVMGAICTRTKQGSSRSNQSPRLSDSSALTRSCSLLESPQEVSIQNRQLDIYMQHCSRHHGVGQSLHSHMYSIHCSRITNAIRTVGIRAE